MSAKISSCAARKGLLAAACTALLSACAVAPPYERPSAELPQAWRAVPENGRTAPADRWWRLYADATLDPLVEEALRHNWDLAEAVARVDEARALFYVAEADRLPVADANMSAERARSSARSAIPLPAGVPLERNTYQATLNVAYEVDLWGRLRSASDAARAELLASRAAQDTVRTTLEAGVVQSYFTLVALDAQIEATRRTLRLREQTLDLQKVRNRAGLIGDLDLKQVEAEAAAARAQLPALQRSRSAEALGLAVLLGRTPRAIVDTSVPRNGDSGEPPPPIVPQGLPSDLLLRRPDIVEAEQRLIAAHANIAEARASLFPRISLTGYLGGESIELGSLLSGPARIWQLGFALAQPIFRGGSLTQQIEAVRARERQALARYQKTMQQAFREVREALIRQARSRQVFEAEGARVQALQDAVRLARIRYENGRSSQLEVIDAERNLLQAELNRIDALRAQRAAVADLVKALGGGWSPGDSAPPSGSNVDSRRQVRTGAARSEGPTIK